jgi:formylmethanofuran dehydrogenase subunit B
MRERFVVGAQGGSNRVDEIITRCVSERRTVETRFENVACTRCGCLCDDLTVTVADAKVRAVAGACELAAPWWRAQQGGIDESAAARIEGQPVSLAEAIARAGEILSGARWPLIAGDLPAVQPWRAGVALARRTRAKIDPCTTEAAAAFTLATQEVGLATCSLGEIKNRADLLVFWRVDPTISHPRLLDRCQAGDEQPTIVALLDEGQPAAWADVVIPLVAGEELATIAQLRRFEREAPKRNSADSLVDLAHRLRNGRYGVLFFGEQTDDRREFEGLLRLVDRLNEDRPTHACYLGAASGGEEVLNWQTGFCFAVDLADEQPAYRPNDGMAETVLARGEIDACLMLGGGEPLSDAARRRLASIPRIFLTPPGIELPIPPTVQITIAQPGVHDAGAAYRFDGVPIPLTRIFETNHPTAAEVLARCCT